MPTETSNRINRLCAVENESLIAVWSQGLDLNGPLVSYIQAGPVPAYTFGDYSLLTRR